MTHKIDIAVAFLALFVLFNDAYIVQRGIKNEFLVKNLRNACPISAKWVTPETVPSVVQVGSKYLNDGETKRHNKQFAFTPVSTSFFQMLDMVVLPSREVCVLGQKLKNYILPESNQFQTKLSIAAWLLPCFTTPSNHTRTRYCLEQQMNSIGRNDMLSFKRFSERFLEAMQEYYYHHFLVFLE